MADNVTVDNGTGADYDVATDDVGGKHYQRFKMDLGDDGASLPVVDKAVPGVILPTGILVVRKTATPTVTNGAYSALDAVGGLLTFSNAARASGGSIIIAGITVVDKSNTMPALELLLFDQTITADADNAVFDPEDADLANVIGIIKMTDWASFNDNAVASRMGLGLACKLAGTDLFGQLITRTAPTLTSTSDIIVVAHIIQN